jgi:X-X-X-Leu-X-X-Gly heptad repeat protein
MSERDTYGQAGDWLIGAAKRNPEALLVLAAGCALFLRGRNAPAQASSSGSYYDDAMYAEAARRPQTGASAAEGFSRVADGASRLAEGTRQYASDVAERVSNTAAPYASAVSKFADDARQTVASQATRLKEQAQSTVQQGLAQVLREQPLALAALGMAAGATLAAIFPSSEAENQALGPAHEALMSAATQAGASMKTAAGEAGEQLKQAAADRGLNSDALKSLARDVAGTFASKVAGKDEERSPGLVPEVAAPEPGSVR